jgi:RimJ/RimL family protein N-acetyltransferase
MNPILLDFPDSFETERLTIRAPRVGDGAQVAQAVRESRAELQPWMPWAKEEPTAEDSEIRIRKIIAQWITRENLPLHLYLKGTDIFVGGSGLHRFDWNVRRFEIGYWVRTKFAGQGYITEAVNGITHFAFTHLKANRVEIRCDTQNVRSASVARRCGFYLEGSLRHDDLDADGNVRDTLVFSKISPTEFHTYDP